MRKIIETLLEEGIDESMIHRVLDLIEEEYNIVDEGENLKNVVRRMAPAEMPDEKFDSLLDKAEKIEGSAGDYIKVRDGVYKRKYLKPTKNEEGERKAAFHRAQVAAKKSADAEAALNNTEKPLIKYYI